MKKTQTTNIGGIAFILDEDAFLALSKYLESIEKQYHDWEEKAEIMEDIEMRIAELFKTKIKHSSQVITMREVEKVMCIMGNPIDFDADGYSDTKSQPGGFNSGKRFYRNPENLMLGGVCSGLGDYFNVDPVLIRILFLIAFFGLGIGLLVYIALWILTPEADSSLKKNETNHRSGQKMSDFVKAEYDQVKNNWKKRFNSASV